MRFAWTLATLLAAAPLVAQTAPPPTDLAAAFGARPAAWGVALSPDAKRIVYLTPQKSGGTAVVVADIATGKSTPVFGGVGKAAMPQWCAWKSEARLICSLYGVSERVGDKLAYTRMVALDPDGKNMLELGQRTSGRAVQYNQYTGAVLDWLPDEPDFVLMQIDLAEKSTTGTNIKSGSEGTSAQKVNVFTNRMETVEGGKNQVRQLIADAAGAVRVKATIGQSGDGYLRNTMTYFVRAKGSKDWRELASVDLRQAYGLGLLGFDESGDWLLALKPLDGRQALYRIAADGSRREELIFAHPKVDVEGVLRIGKTGRPVAASYVTEARHYHFFDPSLAKIGKSLSAALPGKPPVTVLDESWDGTVKLVFAGDDRDPGRYFIYRPATREMNELVPLRPQLAQLALGEARPVTYPARDGATVPGYLTLPPGRPAKGLPTIVMPHGGPGARDDGGFDWWAQFYVAQGYAVLQPNFRGSTGYGEAWYARNGFQNWPTAIGDVNDGARWLVAQGIADPARLAIVGWSYGGYAALQGNVLDPGLYKAAVAVAPVTDLGLLIEQYRRYTSYGLVQAQVGEGRHVAAGSPARNAAAFRVPVQLFHGDLDLNVDIGQSRAMLRALKDAGKPVELIVYPGLEHSLNDRAARTDMLGKSAAFLAANLGPPSGPEAAR